MRLFSSTFILILVSFVFFNCKNKEEVAPVTKTIGIGIIADCQYCDCDIKWNRYYKKSPQRLKKAIEKLNTHNLAYTIHLGDFIDKDFKSFDSINPIWANLKSESYHVLGNHDFEVIDSLKPLIPGKMGLEKRYYSIDKSNWKFIVLDGNDLSFYGTYDSLKLEETKQLFTKISNDSLPYAQTYNGGLSNEQLLWIKDELDLARINHQNVGFYCHFPAFPIDKHNFWNVSEFLELIDEYKEVKFFMNGHNHEGSYAERKNVHYITYKGMVDTKDSTSYAITQISKDSLYIKGYGREVDRKLVLK